MDILLSRLDQGADVGNTLVSLDTCAALQL